MTAPVGPRIPTEADRLQRLTGDAALATSAEWETATPAVPVARDEEYDRTAAAVVVQALGLIAEQVDDLGVYGDAGLRHWYEQGSVAPHVAVVDQIRTLRGKLADLEAQVCRGAGHTVRDRAADRTLQLTDGRTATVKRGKDRKGWKHAEWQADVRREVLSDLPGTLVDPATGANVNVSSLIESAQAVHSAGAPKVTRLRELGLRADDYSETTPGAWTIEL